MSNGASNKPPIRSVDDLLDSMRPFVTVVDAYRQPSIYSFNFGPSSTLDLKVAKEGDKLIIWQEGMSRRGLSAMVRCTIRSFDPLHVNLTPRLSLISRIFLVLLVAGFVGIGL